MVKLVPVACCFYIFSCKKCGFVFLAMKALCNKVMRKSICRTGLVKLQPLVAER